MIDVPDENNLQRKLWIVDCGLRIQFTNNALVA